MDYLPAIAIGLLITAPTALAILICSRGSAAARAEIRRLTAENERLEARNQATTRHVMTICADHNAEIADLKAQHKAEQERLGAANKAEFLRGVMWERKRPEREAADARWIARMEEQHAQWSLTHER